MGNKPEPVEAMIGPQQKGYYGIPNGHQARLAELIKESSVAVDEVMFCNSGSEATKLYFVQLEQQPVKGR